jgi:N-acetylmuramoyl-L-alanine amidase
MVQSLIILLMAAIIAPPVQARPALTGLAITVADGGFEVVHVLGSASITPIRYFILDNPSRLVVDMLSTENKGIVLPKNYAGSLIAGVRFAQFNATTSRLVIEMAGPGKLIDVVAEQTGFRIEMAREAGSGNLTKRKLSSLPASAPEQKPSASRIRPLVVIDAGHGGADPGAIGVRKTREKDITLAMAKALRNGLLKTGRYRAALTRDDDTYIMLPERVNIARKMKADMFISIHADSNPVPSARGLSVYTVSETASDAEAQALAERENKSDIIGGLDLNTADKDVANILIDLTQRETSIKSADFADALVAAMHPKITKLEGTHRFAGFRVLKAPDVPSVLIELGFLSNEADERLLQSEAYRKMVVASIVKGIDQYRAKQKR